MGFSLKKALPGLATGGLSILYDKLKPKSQTASQVALETPEQTQARQELLRLAMSGEFGDEGSMLQLGEDLGLPTGDFNLSEQERLARQGVTDRFQSGIPSSLQQAIDAALSLTQDEDISGVFNPFKQRVERELQDRSDELRRQAGVFGNLYSTNTIQGLGDVQNRGTEAITSELGRLTSENLNRRLQASQATGSLASLLEELQRGRLSDLLGVGGLERNLTNEGVNQRRTDLLGQRNEQLMRINALTGVLGSQPQYGVPSVTTQTPSNLSQVLNPLLQVGGQLLAAKVGRSPNVTQSEPFTGQFAAPVPANGNRLRLF